MYWVKCPHCKRIIEQGASMRSDKIGTPITKCPECGKPIIDNEMIEWSVVSPLRRFMFSSFGNWRAILHLQTLFAFALYELGFAVQLVLALISEVILAVVGHYLTMSIHEEDIKKSFDRAEDLRYIALMQQIEYGKLSREYEDEAFLQDVCNAAIESWDNAVQTKRSSYVELVRYTGKDMHIKLRSGESFLYVNFPHKVYIKMMNAPSMGSFYKEKIHGKYLRIKL